MEVVNNNNVILEDIYTAKEFDAGKLDIKSSVGNISEKEKFIAAKQILLGLACLYVFTVLCYLYKPETGDTLLTICTTTFPPLATLIMVSYFKDRHI